MSADPAPKILLVDDESANIELLADIFDDCEVLFATDGHRALELAASALPDVILLDIMMPGIDGFEVCRRLKAQRVTADIAVIFLTGKDDWETESEGLTLGAVDYVTKPINPPIVKMRVHNQVELKRARDKLASLAITDGLTGIANRRHFDDTLAQEHGRLARGNGELSLILLDIDHFKPFNDLLGHVAGDDALRRVALAIDGAMKRPGDIAARYGGEEFACILPETSADGAMHIAHDLHDAIAGLAIPHPDSPTSPILTISSGVATVMCRPGRSVLQVLAAADEQLYVAKTSGRDRVAGDCVPA
jgi:diguanylate cyclase (GGDEF)-like protein